MIIDLVISFNVWIYRKYFLCTHFLSIINPNINMEHQLFTIQSILNALNYQFMLITLLRKSLEKLGEVSCAHQGCICVIQNTVKILLQS